MSLKQTKKILKRYIDKESNYLKRALLDIKPDYSERRIGLKAGEGYSYKNFEPFEVDIIYNSIRELESIVNDKSSALHLNTKEVFITKKKVIVGLNDIKEFVEKKLKQLNNIEQKYRSNDSTHYALNVCLLSYQEISELLKEVYDSIEMKEFLEPNIISKLKKENIDLKFNSYWRNRKWNYLVHLLLFIPFLCMVIFVLVHKSNPSFNGLAKTTSIVGVGLIMISFNLFFNNHNSFKNSFKLLWHKSRKKLIAVERKRFEEHNE